MVTIASGAARRSQRLETTIVAGAAVALAIGCAGYALLRGEARGMPELLDWQVSAFAGLGPDDQAIHSALASASDEIGWYNYDFNTWPTPEELDEQLLPPFYKDGFWEQHGRVEWKLLAAADFMAGGATAYMGTHGQQADQNSYLLVFQHRHLGAAYSNQSEVWIFDGTDPSPPTGYKSETLVKAGWKRVVAYSGADEVERMKGI